MSEIMGRLKSAIKVLFFKKKEDPRFIKFREDLVEFNKQGQKNNIVAKEENLFPCLDDNTSFTGFDAHYIYHPAWACRIVKEINPSVHIDISSTLHFCSMLSAFIPVEFYDYRPAILNLDNLESKRADLTSLPFPANSIHSISCMHTVEHIGLGRYGDPLDVEGDLKAILELKRVCAESGNLLFVVPIGKSRIMFNAHRIYDPQHIINLFEGFTLVEFSAVLDDQTFIRNVDINIASEQNYACGCFWFRKNENS